MGAAAVLMTAGSGIAPKSLKGVIADSSFDALDKQMAFLIKRKYKNQLRPFLLLVQRVVLKRFGFPIEKASPESVASRIKVPVLLFHGTDDVLVPSYMSENIFNRIRAGKRICLIEGAAHVMGYDAAPEKYSAEIEKFRESISDNEWQRLIGRVPSDEEDE
jgi:fermentation-respiration switch protein FrsA (DUF1100 family)